MMMSEWKDNINDIVEFTPKRTIKKGNIAPFIDMAAVPVNGKFVHDIGSREYKGGGSRFTNGDTLFARITPCLENGKTAKVTYLNPGDIAHGSTEFIVMSAKQPDYDEDFVYYLARNPEFRSFAQARMEGTSGRQRVSWQSLTDFSYVFPPKEERKAIAHILGSLDDKIELNRKMNETLEAMAQTLFKSWFVDFDPVIDNALAAGNPIPDALRARAELRMLNAELKNNSSLITHHSACHHQFPDAFELTDELGWIPKGWKVSSIGEVLELAYGKSLSAKNREPGPFPVYGSGGIAGYHKSAIVEGPSVIVGRKGTVGSVYWEEGDCFPIDTVFYVKLKCDIPLYWACQKLQNMDIASLGADSAVPGVNRNAVYIQSWLMPGSTALSHYWDVLACTIKKRLELGNQNKALTKLRDTLLPKLLSGEVRVPDAEAIVEDVG
jgi:type I restriction enzyme, S subunit